MTQCRVMTTKVIKSPRKNSLQELTILPKHFFFFKVCSFLKCKAFPFILPHLTECPQNRYPISSLCLRINTVAAVEITFKCAWSGIPNLISLMATIFRYTPNIVKHEMFTTVLKTLTTLVIKAIVHIFPKCLVIFEIQ